MTSPAIPSPVTREYLSALMPLLHGEPVDFRGDIHHVVGQVPTPGAQPPSVLLAALGPVMLRIAGELADGTVAVWTGVRTVATHIVPRITSAAEAAGRPAPRVLVNLPIAVTDDSASTRNWIAEHFGGASTVPRYRALFEMEGASGGADARPAERGGGVVGAGPTTTHTLRVTNGRRGQRGRVGGTESCADVRDRRRDLHPVVDGTDQVVSEGRWRLFQALTRQALCRSSVRPTS